MKSGRIPCMALFFISGVPGTGKSTLMHELRRRGEEAHDTDDECVMISKQTGNLIDYDERKNEPYDWVYPTKMLQKLKSRSSSKNVFLLGSVDNWDEVYATADEYIWMYISLDGLIKRLDGRLKAYGKSSSERQSIIDLHREMSTVMGPKTFTLDAAKPVEHIDEDLLAHANNYSKAN